jgi:uncharacterized protein YkwD
MSAHDTAPRRRFSRIAATAAALTIAAGAAVATGSTSADAATTAYGPAPRLSTYDARLLHDINHARAAHGRAPLRATAGTTDVAHRWSCHMGHYSTLSHRPNLVVAISSSGSAAWHVMGENVGVSAGGDADALFRAYMNSPKHRANILDSSYRFLGIHTELRHGQRWNTLDFVDRYSGTYGATRATC